MIQSLKDKFNDDNDELKKLKEQIDDITDILDTTGETNTKKFIELTENFTNL